MDYSDPAVNEMYKQISDRSPSFYDSFDDFTEDFEEFGYLTLNELVEWSHREHSAGLTSSINWLINELKKIWSGNESDFRIVITVDI